MNCAKCQKPITKSYNCNKCDKNFCTNSCMINHIFETHQSGANNDAQRMSISLKRKTVTNSVFISQGEFLKDVDSDNYYDFPKFEFVMDDKTKKKRILGTGSFGNVYLARHKEELGYYAIKQIEKLKVQENGAKLDIIFREINIHRRLVHDNIIKFYSYHETKDSIYMIMEYAKNGTLFQKLKRKKYFDEKAAFPYFIQAANSVLFLHENNLVHRDLKPENLLLMENEKLKLCDFGWCVEISMGNRITFCGTYEYMAPEIIKEKPYNLGIDVWSLGILLYELVHGFSPFRSKNNESEDYNEIFKNIVKYNFKIEREDISLECKDLIKKLLSPDLKTRIKVREIFNHPWVQGFEAEQKSKKIENEVSKPSYMQKYKENLQGNEEESASTSASVSVVESNKNQEFGLLQEPINAKIVFNDKKKSTIKITEVKPVTIPKISFQNTQQADIEVDDVNFSLLKNDNGFSLFDTVLNKVQEKNKVNAKKLNSSRNNSFDRSNNMSFDGKKARKRNNSTVDINDCKPKSNLKGKNSHASAKDLVLINSFTHNLKKDELKEEEKNSETKEKAKDLNREYSLMRELSQIDAEIKSIDTKFKDRKQHINDMLNKEVKVEVESSERKEKQDHFRMDLNRKNMDNELRHMQNGVESKVGSTSILARKASELEKAKETEQRSENRNLKEKSKEDEKPQPPKQKEEVKREKQYIKLDYSDEDIKFKSNQNKDKSKKYVGGNEFNLLQYNPSDNEDEDNFSLFKPSNNLKILNDMKNLRNEKNKEGMNFELIPQKEKRDSIHFSSLLKEKVEEKRQEREREKERENEYDDSQYLSERNRELHPESDLYDFSRKKDNFRSKKELLDAIDILERANENKRKEDSNNIDTQTGLQKFINWFNPFKCG